VFIKIVDADLKPDKGKKCSASFGYGSQATPIAELLMIRLPKDVAIALDARVPPSAESGDLRFQGEGSPPRRPNGPPL